MNNCLQLINVSKSHPQGHTTNHILTNINLTVARGEVIALLGRSGSGKSTLLNIVGLLDFFQEGTLLLNGANCTNLTSLQKSEVRKNNIGFVFQFHHLLADFTALENVTIPALILNQNSKTATKKATDLLEQVGLADKLNCYPSELSGGERQRVAIARALVNNPTILLADEPTGNLDSELSMEITNLILNLVKNYNSSAIIATHDLTIANKIGKQVTLMDGKLNN